MPAAGNLVFRDLAAGIDFTCGVTMDGDGYCWGVGNGGQIGDSTYEDRLIPTRVAGGLKFRQITAGVQHVCGLTVSGAAYCWGVNDIGELGNGANTLSINSPTAVAGNLTFTMLSARFLHTCGLVVNGAAYCWGSNSHGGLGDGTTDRRNAPVAVQGGLHFQWIAAGQEQTCGIAIGGDVYCWGQSESGQLGDGSTTPRFAPVLIRVP
jgi:alpha-tubulin suppressor-like RCC1 family protein